MKKLSPLNDEIDIKLFFYIAKRNLVFAFIFILVSLLTAFVYLRYTYPIYQAKSVLQISVDNNANKILQMENIYENDLAKEIELLRSSIFLERAFSKLPLQVSYYSKGTILDFEQYKNSPYSISYKIKNPAIYSIPIHIDFVDNNYCIISYSTNKSHNFEKKYYIKDKIILPEAEIDLKINNERLFNSSNGLLIKKNILFFVINNPSNVISNYLPNLNITILNEAAKTIQINLKDRNAAKASDIVNAISEEFIVYDIEKKAESANNVLNFVDNQLEIIYDKLYESEEQLQQFQKLNKIDTNRIKNNNNLLTLSNNYENQLVNLEIEENVINEIDNNLLKTKNLDVYKIISVMAGADINSSLSGLLKSLQELLVKKEQLLYDVTQNSPQIESINYQIEIQKKILFESIKNIRQRISLKKMELNKKIIDIDNKNINSTDNYNTLEYIRLTRMHSINEKFYNQLITKKAEYSISRAGYVSQTIILEKSNVPTVPISPNNKLIYAISLIIGIFLGIGLMILRYVLYNEITSINDIQKRTSIPILGLITKYKSDIPVSQLIVDKKPKSLISEALRTIRTNLQFISNIKGSKLIAVTSTISSEGKTFFSINLAGIIAFSDKKVVVVDLDMRKPKIHIGFNVENIKGASSILSGKETIESCVQHSGFRNLDIISAGPIPPNPSELIYSDKMEELIMALKEKYDYVIIDNPPVGIVSDGIKSIQLADYPIYVFKANYSKKSFVQNAEDLKEKNDIKKLSIVLNAVEPQYSSYAYGKGKSYYGHQYGYGFGYYEDDFILNKKSNYIIRILKKLLNIKNF